MGYRTRFIEVDYNEPHKKRTEEILKKYPQIKDLYGPCPRTKYICTAAILFQFFMATTVSSWSWPWAIAAAWAISGTINHMLSLATHELSHNLAFADTWKNDALGMACNLAMGVPSTITFRKYHMEHHRWQGVIGIDTDIPTAIEGRIIGNNPVFKLLFLILQPAFYAIRPMLVRPKRKTRAEWINLFTVLLSDSILLFGWGPKALFYVFGGTLLGLSIHPTAGHFLAEHYVWDEPTETYSYYGPLNAVAWNVGYHVEHHDFPRVPGSRLPQLREIAKEYYPTNPKYQSWVGVLVRFVLDPNMGIYNRVVRKKSD